MDGMGADGAVGRNGAVFAEIDRWMRRNARPLDLARWRMCFGEGTAEAVLEAMEAYQNPDGGIGHALEPDAWNPASSPLQTSTAIDLIDEAGWRDALHPVVQGILRYLDSRCDMDEAQERWLLAVPSNDLHPRAPWWTYGTAGGRERSEFNPTAILVGFLLRHAAPGSERHAFAEPIARDLLGRFLDGPPLEMHPLACVIAMLDSLAESWYGDRAALKAAGAKAAERARALVRQDAGDWTGYACRPSFFVDGPRHPLAEGLEKECAAECDALLAMREPDGVWGLTWRWDAYEREFAVSENWWKAELAIRYVRFLRNFGRI